MKLENISIKDIQDIDFQFAYFHYTNNSNIKGIDRDGLIPKIGNSATGIELTEKVFFAIGVKGVFAIFDSWLRWLIAKRLTDLPGEKADIPFYRLCTFLMRLPIFRYLMSAIVNFAVWIEFKLPSFKIKSFKIMKNILDNSSFLILDLKEEIDFSYKDIDEVKAQCFDRKLLHTVYARQNKMNSKKMDYWNMHTFSNITILPNKITLLKTNDSYCCTDILLWMVKNTKIDLKVFAPYLYDFLNYYDLLDNKFEKKL